MKQQDFATWLEALGHAWERHDSQAAASLFAEDALYQESPFQEPLRGRSAIGAHFATVPRFQQNIRFSYELLAVTGSMGLAHWRASFLRLPLKVQVNLDGIVMVSLDDRGLCRELREWLVSQEDKPEAFLSE